MLLLIYWCQNSGSLMLRNGSKILQPIKGRVEWQLPFCLCCFLGYQFSSVQSLSRVRLFASPWIAARQASLSITNQSRVGGMKRSIFNWLIGLSGYNERALYPLLPLPSNTPSHLLFLPTGNNSGRYPGFLACDSSFLIPLALFFFSFPCYKLRTGKAFWNIALKARNHKSIGLSVQKWNILLNQ